MSSVGSGRTEPNQLLATCPWLQTHALPTCVVPSRHIRRTFRGTPHSSQVRHARFFLVGDSRLLSIAERRIIPRHVQVRLGSRLSL